MKIFTICSQCLKIHLEKGAKYGETNAVNLQINDGGIHPFTCMFGHKNAIINYDEKFETLFESAAYAIDDGYYKEAVSSIASSLEALYEYSIKVLLLSSQLEMKQIRETWKNISQQSERQLGAFIMLYFREFGTCPPVLNQQQVEFRNRSIHKGYFPNIKEVKEFGEAILKIMFQILIMLRTNIKEGIKKYKSIRTEEMMQKAKDVSDYQFPIQHHTIFYNANEGFEYSKVLLLENYLKDLLRIEKHVKFD